MAEVTNKKKTLYEILEVSPDASHSEIQAAYQRVSQKLQSEKTALNREEIDSRLKMLDMVLHALSYEARLVKQNAPSNVAAPRTAIAAPLNFDTVSLKADAASLKADAMSFKADAMSLKADAMSLIMADTPHRIAVAPLKTAAVPLKFPAAVENDHQLPLAIISSAVTSSASALKKILRIIAGLMVLGVIFKISFMVLSNNHAGRVATPNNDEKVFLQEYYQTHGVRVGSKIEADLLDEENRRKENQQREEARDKQRQDDEYRRFVEESRREGEKISENLRRDEQAARYEEQNKQRQLAQEKLNKEEAERYRIEEERRQVEEARRRLGLN